MAYSYVTWETSKSPGDTINVSYPYLQRQHVVVVVGGVEVAQSLYQWTSNGTIECLTGFPPGAGRAERRTPRSGLPSEQQGSGSFNWAGANENDKTLLYIQQEVDDGEEARQAVTDELVEGYGAVLEAAEVATAAAGVAVGAKDVSVTKASEAGAAAGVAVSAAGSSSSSAGAAATSAADAHTDRVATQTAKGQVDTAKGLVDTAKGLVDTAKTAVDTQKGLVDTKAAQVVTDAAAVAALYDAFDDRYLGSKASNPTLDNDGLALLDGAIYWNSVVKELRFYSVSGTAWIAANNVLSAVPVGMIGAFPINAAPAGWLIANGSTFSSATYPDLATYLGSTTLPDLRGEFIRGLDNGRGVDTSRVNMSSQLDAGQRLTGTMVSGRASGSADFNTRPPTGVFTGTATADVMSWIGSSASLSRVDATFDSANSPGARTATETRPRNVAMVLCIKAFGGIINQGALDAAAVAADQLNFIRFNAAQTLTQTQKGQVAANSGQAWEQIGAHVVVSSAVAQLVWTDLSAYRQLRLTISGLKVSVADPTVFIHLSADNGGTFPADTYVGNINYGQAATTAAVALSETGFRAIVASVGNTGSNSASASGDLSEFNVSGIRTRWRACSEAERSGGLMVGVVGQVATIAALNNAFRLIASSGNITAGRFTLEGMRG